MPNKTAADEKVSDIYFVYYENNKPGQLVPLNSLETDYSVYSHKASRLMLLKIATKFEKCCLLRIVCVSLKVDPFLF